VGGQNGLVELGNLRLDPKQQRRQRLERYPSRRREIGTGVIMDEGGVLDNGARFAISFVHTIAREALRHRSTGPTLKPQPVDEPGEG
jgi:hypothetical protein